MKGYVHPDFTDKFSGPDLTISCPEDGFSMTDYDRAWRESVDARLDRILELLQPVVKPKVERPAIYFDDFWQLYPKKCGKKQCVKIWKSRLLDHISERICADVSNRVVNCAKWKSGFAPNPATYLNGDRWQDEIQKASSVPVEVPKELNALVRYAAKSGLQAKVGEPLHEFRARVVREVAGEDS